MSDEPKVELSGDDLEKQQWGRDLLFKRDGQKLSLDTKRVIWGAGGVFLLVATLPLFESAPSATTSGESSISVPATTSSESAIPITPLGSNFEQENASKGAGRTGRGTVRFTGPQLIARPRNLKAIPPGTIIKAIVMSGASNGLARVETKEAVMANRDVLIESGSVLLGTGNSNEDRLMIRFDQVVFKDGTFGQINAQACDSSDKIVGLKGSKLGNRALNIAGSIGLGFLGGFSEGLQETRGEGGAVVKKPSMKNALLNGTSTAALEQSKNLMSELKDRTPVIEVPAQTPIYVIFGVNQ